MLQRSPSYFFAPPTTNELAVTLRALDIPEEWTHEILRRQFMAQIDLLARMSIGSRPTSCTRSSSSRCARCCPKASTSKSTSPRATAPGSSASPSSRTATCSRRCARARPRSSPTPSRRSPSTGSGSAPARRSRADIVVSATGFNLSLLGDVAFAVDGEPVDFTERVTWRGIMISGVPNMAYVFGYFRHSWTLRVDLVCDLLCRLLASMRDKGATMVTPALRPRTADMPLRPLADPENFNPGYVMRSQHLLFKQGDREPWTHLLEHEQERDILPKADLDDGTLVYR